MAKSIADAKHAELTGYKWEINGDGLTSTGVLLSPNGHVCAEFDNEIFTYKVFGEPPWTDISPLMPYDKISLEFLERQVVERVNEFRHDARSDELLSRSNDLENQLNAAEAKVSELEARIAKLEAENKSLINNSDEVRAGQGVFKVICTFKNGETVTDFFDNQPSIESMEKTMQIRQEFFKKRDGIEFEYAIEKSNPAEMYKARYERLYAANYRLKTRCAELESKTRLSNTAKINTHDKPRPVREELEKAIKEAKSNTGQQQQNKLTQTHDIFERR